MFPPFSDQTIYKIAIDKSTEENPKIVVKELTLSLARTRSETLYELDNEADLNATEVQVNTKYVYFFIFGNFRPQNLFGSVTSVMD